MVFSEAAQRHGLDNTPPPDVRQNLLRLCDGLLEPLRELIGKPILVNSGYRSPEVNKAIGGSMTSEHMDGRAVDFRVLHMKPYEICRLIETNTVSWDLKYNQLIHEFGAWVHISIPKIGQTAKGEKLTAKKVEGKTVYLPGIFPV